MSSTSTSSSSSKVMNIMKTTVKFLPFTSTVDSPFWVQYNHLKLEKIKLNEDPIDIVASYGIGGESTARLQCIETSLDISQPISNDRIAVYGKLIGLNTLEAFQKLDKNQFLANHFDQSTKVLQFVLLTFCDLKSHKVLYWFGIPALMSKTPIQVELLTDSSKSSILQDFNTKYHQLRLDCLQQDNNHNNGLPAFFVFDNNHNGNNKLHLLNKDCLSSMSNNNTVENLVFGFVDSVSSGSSGSGNGNGTTATTNESSSSSIIMGWPLRTMLSYLSIVLKLGGQTVTIISYRPSRLRKITTTAEEEVAAVPPPPGSSSSSDNDNSLVFRIQVPNDYEYSSGSGGGESTTTKTLKVVGWELNTRQKPGPRWCNLRPLLDSNHLAIQAADLNLKLMKWRMLPNLNISKLQTTKVLLLGAGTLGCSVARTLLGWGIRHFTILDYGNVSYSNPVRQNLFILDDCHYENGSGKLKAQAACDSLKQIAADVTATSIKLSIPMPGHSAETLQSITESVTKLDKLIEETDVVFLLTDTRESRWLPTVMAAAHDKLLINAALGLDSWLVMRHGGGIVDGSSTDATTTVNNNNRLGCYFCNDIVAPENSTKNRTLDQQCTVTRPGLAPIASSMAVELMVSTLHHPKVQHAPAPSPMAANKGFTPSVSTDEDSSFTSALGVMPHQIRGSIVSYTMMTPTVPAFKCCTACSPPIVEAYKQQNIKVDLVYEACQSKDGSYLEKISGLTEFRAEAAEKLASMEADMDMDDDAWDDM